MMASNGNRIVETPTRNWAAGSFLFRFCLGDHQILGRLFFVSAITWLLLGGLLAIAIRWQITWPWTPMPLLGAWFFSDLGGQVTPEFYDRLLVFHAIVMVFFGLVTFFQGGIGSFLIPLMIGAERMAVPRLGLVGFGLTCLSFTSMVLAFCWPLGSSKSQALLSIGIAFFGAGLLLTVTSQIVTIVQLRCKEMEWRQLPLTIWGTAFSSAYLVVAIPVIAGLCLIAQGGAMDQLDWIELLVGGAKPAIILLSIGIVSDVIACFGSRKSPGDEIVVLAMAGVAGVGIVQIFLGSSGQAEPIVDAMVLLPLTVVLIRWTRTIWKADIRLKTPMLFAIAAVLIMFMGLLAGILRLLPGVESLVHETHFSVGQQHALVFGSSLMAAWAATYYWFPKLFGVSLNEVVGKLHFWLTFVLSGVSVVAMQFLSRMPRRMADTSDFGGANDVLQINQIITYGTFVLAAAQLLLLLNCLGCRLFGRPANGNPWGGTTLEWTLCQPSSGPELQQQPTSRQGVFDNPKEGLVSDSEPQGAD